MLWLINVVHENIGFLDSLVSSEHYGGVVPLEERQGRRWRADGEIGRTRWRGGSNLRLAGWYRSRVGLEGRLYPPARLFEPQRILCQETPEDVSTPGAHSPVLRGFLLLQTVP